MVPPFFCAWREGYAPKNAEWKRACYAMKLCFFGVLLIFFVLLQPHFRLKWQSNHIIRSIRIVLRCSRKSRKAA